MTVDESGPRRARIGQWMARGWDMYAQDWPLFTVIGCAAAAFLAVGNVLLAGPALAGLAHVSNQKLRGETPSFSGFLEGFNYYVWSLLATLLIALMATVGFAMLIVPGVVIVAMYQFTFHFIVDRGEDFWTAMESSRTFISRDYFGFTLFLLVLIAINFLGICFFVAGFFVTLPVSALAVSAAFLDQDADAGAESDLPTEPVVIE